MNQDQPPFYPYDCTVLSNRGQYWGWKGITVGIFKWNDVMPRPHRGKVEVQVYVPLTTDGLMRGYLKCNEVLRKLKAGTYTGESVLDLR